MRFGNESASREPFAFRVWKMRFTLWWGRFGSTGWKSSTATKMGIRAVWGCPALWCDKVSCTFFLSLLVCVDKHSSEIWAATGWFSYSPLIPRGLDPTVNYFYIFFSFGEQMAKLKAKVLRNSCGSRLLAVTGVLTELIMVGFFCIRLLSVSFLWETVLFFPFWLFKESIISVLCKRNLSRKGECAQCCSLNLLGIGDLSDSSSWAVYPEYGLCGD